MGTVGVVATVNALAGERVARVGVAVALARAAIRKVPVAVDALVALAAFDQIVTLALARVEITAIVLRARRMTVARFGKIVKFYY